MKCLRRKALWSALLASVILATLPVVAQTASSSLRGTVLEEDGKPSVGAIVQARSIATGAVRVATTDESGRYILQALPVGQWTVVARSTAGAVSESVQVELHLQGAPIQNLTVGGGLTERVAVTAAARIIDRKETGGKLRIDAEKVSVLPSAGRVFTDLALLDSSVRPAAEGAFLGEAGSVFVVNGASGRSNSFLVDGLDNNDLTSGTSLSSFFSQQVIQEFVLLTHRYSPEFGRATGGVLNIVTKQGGNESRHEGFFEGAIGSWSESGSFIESLPAGSPPLAGSSRTKTEQYTVGFNFGGAFKKDRAFYFGAYEHSKIDKLIGYTGIDRNGVPGGRFVAPGTGDNFFVRTDFNLGDNRRLMIRASYDDRETAGVNVGGLYTPEAGFEIDEKDVGLAVSLTAIASPSAVSETRFAFSQSTFNQFANSELSGVTRPGGIFGGNPLNTQLRDETKFQFVENITWTRGSHTLKFGMDITHSRIQLDARFNPNGGFLYGSDEPFEPGDCGNINISDVINADRPDGTGTYPFVPCPNGDPNADLDGDGILNEPAKITTYPVVFSYVFGQPSSRFDDTKYGFFALDDQVDVVAAEFDDLEDARDGPDAIEPTRLGIVIGRVALGDDRDELALANDVVEQVESLSPTNGDGHDRVREQHAVAQWQDPDLLRHLEGLGLARLAHRVSYSKTLEQEHFSFLKYSAARARRPVAALPGIPLNSGDFDLDLTRFCRFGPGDPDFQDPVLVSRGNAARVDRFGQQEAPDEAAVAPLAAVGLPLFLVADAFAGQDQGVVLDLHVERFALDPGNLGAEDQVIVLIEDVHRRRPGAGTQVSERIPVN